MKKNFFSHSQKYVLETQMVGNHKLSPDSTEEDLQFPLAEFELIYFDLFWHQQRLQVTYLFFIIQNDILQCKMVIRYGDSLIVLR